MKVYLVILAALCLAHSAVAHDDDDDHAHAGDACTLTSGTATYDLEPLKRCRLARASLTTTHALIEQDRPDVHIFRFRVPA